MSRLRSIWLVARRELLERGRSRAFAISVGVSVALIAGALFLPALIGRTDRARIGVVGTPPAGVVARLDAVAAATNQEIRTESVGDEPTGEARVRDGSLDGLLVFPTDGGVPTYVAKDRSKSLLQQVVASAFTTPPQLQLRELEPADPNRDVAFAFANVGVILLFISIFTFGTWVLTGVVEEKQSRVVEVVLATVEPRDLLIGKVLGIGLLGIAQLIVMVAFGLIAGTASGRFTLPPTTGSAVAMLLLWFVLGYAFYSTALGVLGALASRMEEASNAASPVSFLATGAYLFSLLVALNDPAGTAARVATFLPPVSPMVIPLRAALGAIEPWEIVVSAIEMVVVVAILFELGGRVYSGAVLQSGARIGLRQAWRIARGG
jgi:ABC-2 type transport system permease protein